VYLHCAAVDEALCEVSLCERVLRCRCLVSPSTALLKGLTEGILACVGEGLEWCGGFRVCEGLVNRSLRLGLEAADGDLGGFGKLFDGAGDGEGSPEYEGHGGVVIVVDGETQVIVKAKLEFEHATLERRMLLVKSRVIWLGCLRHHWYRRPPLVLS